MTPTDHGILALCYTVFLVSIGVWWVWFVVTERRFRKDLTGDRRVFHVRRRK